MNALDKTLETVGKAALSDNDTEADINIPALRGYGMLMIILSGTVGTITDIPIVKVISILIIAAGLIMFVLGG